MDSPANPFAEFLSLIKSWLPWRPDPANLSRDFWMPDESCRVCYECDTQFTIINRRHHCRLCGRVFCGKCTSNSIPAKYTNRQGTYEEWERVRVCNYCFKQWKQNLNAVNNGEHLPDHESVTLPSAKSYSSCKSIKTSNSCYSPMSHSVESHQYAQQSSNLISNFSSPTGMSLDVHMGPQGRDNYGASNLTSQAVPYPSQYGFPFSRDYVDGDHYGMYQSDSEARYFSLENDYDNQNELDNLNNIVSRSLDLHDDQNKTKTERNITSHVHLRFNSQESSEFSRLNRKEEDNFISDAASSTADDIISEPVDFENSGILWLPPEPEDEEDEKESLFDDDDDGYVTREWGYLHASDSFGSGEFRSKDQSVEEQKMVMKNVIYGHFRALIAQLLQVENLPVGGENSEDSWLDTITSLSWEAATLLKPDMSKSGGMDPGGYVKVKCVASGRCTDSVVVKGVVCKKNVAHRRMISRFEKPRILILGGALEYQRVANHLSSFDTLLQQETDHLKMAVAKIDAHHPDVLLVENSVSRYAQEYLLAKDISLVLNIKRPLLERIARCTGAQIVPCIDHLSSQNLGYCEKFHVQRVLEEHGTAGQGRKKLTKTLMYFEGCPKPLGYTILLKGAPGDDLKKVKHVVQYGVFAAYHLALETSFLSDERASLPEFPLRSPITVALPGKSSSIERSISIIPGFTILSMDMPQGSDPQRSNSVPVPGASTVTSVNSVDKLDKASPPTFSPNADHPPLQTSSNLFQSTSLDHSAKASWEAVSNCLDNLLGPNGALEETREKMSLERKGLSHGFVPPNRENFMAISGNPLDRYDSEDARLPSNIGSASTLKHSGMVVTEAEPSTDEFPPSPSDHQSILVSLSSRCVWKGTICERSHLFRIKYYGSFDKPLGRFLRDHLFDQGYRCDSCEMPSEAHVHCYTHRQGTLTISVKKLPEVFLPGQMDGKIWMWHRCLQCPRINGFPPATRRVVMSDAAWGLSFGKFLELSFSNHAAASRVASCGHSLHRDCLRFYGFGNMVACFRYASIDVHSVYLPPSKLDFSCKNQDWIQKEADEVVNRAELLFSEIRSAVSQIAGKRLGGSQSPYGVYSFDLKQRFSELEEMLQKERSELMESFEKSRKETMKNQPIMDILDLNRIRRQLLFQSYLWDHRLVLVSALYKDLADGDKSSIVEGKVNIVSKNGTLPDQTIFIESEIGTSGSLPSDRDISTSVNGKQNSESQYEEHDLVSHGTYSGESIDCIRHSQITSDNSEPLEAGTIVRRTASEGQFPTARSLSDSLDAAWTGESQPIFPEKKEISSALSDPAALSSLRGGGTVEALAMNGFAEDLSKVRAPTSFPTMFSGKDFDYNGVERGWLGIPIMTFSHSFNKDHLVSSQKLDLLNEYNPVYISCLREQEVQGVGRVLLPVGINGAVIPIYDDEPTSVIAYALTSSPYHAQLLDEGERLKDGEPVAAISSTDSSNFHLLQSIDDVRSFQSLGSVDEFSSSIFGSRSSANLDPLSHTKAMHAKVSFGDDGPLGKAKFSVTCYYAKRFEALRRVCCPSEVDYVRSLSRCKKWGAQGGKSNVFFAKTLDERFIIKQVTKTELESFIKFAPAYFKYLSESIDSRSPTCLAKILGMYQVTSKNSRGGKESKMDVLVMENLLFQRNVVRLYDLKGSSRSRYNPDSSGANKVLLDQNLIESMPTAPIFVGNKAKRLLERAVWNDTSFLASVDVMDYSLLVGIDEEKHELVLGIIDFMRQYTWDKHLETWVKASGILGGPKNASPTVISPKQYKKRFRKAMTTYFLMVPDQWSPPTIIPSRSQSDLHEEETRDMPVPD
ncbi:hypothetical protein MLD38_005176 [Melastoma candidum]|uniref:Uncharacterized protein n=1 Tax=Melastoma candidum TaxID=119954 RepID=A0ACB9SBA9_9MYRT|nr:hypothetical protein MLD38_005176 [Melastoma candidum]